MGHDKAQKLILSLLRSGRSNAEGDPYLGSPHLQSRKPALLLHGPNGTGKTDLVLAAVASTGVAFINIPPGALLERHNGEAEAYVTLYVHKM